MKSLEFQEPKRYDFKIVYHEYDMVGVQKVESQSGQYVSYEAYSELLKAFEEEEMNQYE